MIDLTTPIIPYKGTGIFDLYGSYKDIKDKMQSQKIKYTEEVWKETDMDPSWTIINIGEDIELFFTLNKLFKIVLMNNFKGSLPNGINMTTLIEDAKKIDPTLAFDNWDEIYISDNGYWIEDNLDTKKLLSISIFIREIDEDDYYKYLIKK